MPGRKTQDRADGLIFCFLDSLRSLLVVDFSNDLNSESFKFKSDYT